MIKFKHLLLVVMVMSTPAIAGKLMVTETLKVLEINGVEYEGSLFEKDVAFDISSGEQKLLLKYQEFFEDDDENFATIRSKPFLFIFDANNQDDYKLTTPLLDSESDGKDFAKQPKVILSTTSGKRVKSRVALLSQTKVTAPDKVISESTSTANSITQSTTVLAKDVTKKPINTMPTALSMLEYWWQQASESERELFLSELNKESK